MSHADDAKELKRAVYGPGYREPKRDPRTVELFPELVRVPKRRVVAPPPQPVDPSQRSLFGDS